ncbi:MAG: hypothetical protein M3Y13_10665 [Armatimonadota bacterium]|nr:hypothetical protein [Armatimonadota bacterium]
MNLRAFVPAAIVVCLAFWIAGTVQAIQVWHVSPDPLPAVPADHQFRTIGEAAKGVAPGDTILIHSGLYRESVTIDKSGTAAQPIRFVRGQALPAASLEMLAKPRSLIGFSSTFLDFGEVKAGSRKTLPLTVTLVPGFSRAVDSISLLVLKSSSPDIRIERVSITPQPLPLEQTPAGEVLHHFGQGAVPDPDANVPTVIAYRLTLAPSKTVGGIDGKVSLVDPRSPHLLVTQGASIPVVGHVTGEISASPGAVDFGLVRAGRPASRRVAIHGTSLTILRGFQIGALPPYLSAHWLETAPLATGTVTSDNTRHLEVMLTANPPAGVSTTQVIITARNGQMLRIPIMLNILPNPKGQQ